MNCRLFLITLLTITTIHASDSDASSNSEQTPVATQIALTRARLGILLDAATRLTHLEEAALEKQLSLDTSDKNLTQKMRDLEIQSAAYQQQFEDKKQEIDAAQATLNGLLAQDTRQRNNQQTKSNV